MTLFEAELGPLAACGDTGRDGFPDDGFADPLGEFDFFAGVVEGVGDFGLGAVFVGCDGRRGKGGGVVELFVVSPVRAAVGEVSVEMVGMSLKAHRLTWLFWTWAENLQI